MAETKEELAGLSLDDEGGSIKLISKDEEAIDIEKKFAFISKLVKTSLESDTSSTEVPIPGVAAEILQLVCDYMNHHKGVEPAIIEKPLRSKLMKDVCKDPWDADYIDKIGDERQKLYDLILAANYMDIKSLLHLGCAKVASLIKGQPLDKIRDILAVNGAKKEESKDDEKKA
jgi:S-phase kinase-associated protein 1